MKRISILAAFLLLAVGAKAQTYSYLTFQQTDGTQKSLTANGLKITFSGNTLTATSAEGTTTLPLTDLTKMFFASEVSGVLNPTGGQTLVTIGEGSISVSAPVGTTIRVYTTGGRLLTNFRKRWSGTEEICSGLERGLYFVSVGSVTSKVYIR
ncbi:hypothetical protein HMPREF9332_01912 [Alloprevotella rava F0323]|uniref:Secretion system C-terminal sorting domain-containing protein n=1 Tax=Alloprevotella rava F0323 TaxID=679199 RepID=G5GEB0_9BACT|nr:hypothetical protein [Alloprevotella rava]EHG20963.1 hypothetical protein HMPREF9332_01912 [Alloprevotella rava F0323]